MDAKENEPVMKTDTVGSAHVGSLEESNSQRQEVGGQVPGLGRGIGSRCVEEAEASLGGGGERDRGDTAHHVPLSAHRPAMHSHSP